MTKKQKLKPISQNLIIERLKFENPWWVTGKIDQDDQDKRPRLYCDLFYPLIKESEINRAVVLMGPRRVGKTVMMHHTIAKLIDSGINKHKICFIAIDNPIYLNMGLEELFNLAKNALATQDTKEWYIFFDEIQYLKNWEQHLKVLVDSYPKSKFIVSGSAAAALKLKSIESGAGRFTEFMLPPLTFHEYIHLKNFDHLIKPATSQWNKENKQFFTSINIKEINQHFIDYINFGGFPEVIFSDKIRSNPARYIKNDIVDKVLLRDLPSMYGIQDVQELNSFFSTLTYYSGNEVSLDTLSKSSGVEKNLLKKYLDYLEAAFLIKVVNRIDDSAKKFQRNTFYKIYLTNPSMRSALFSPINSTDEAIGDMVETAIFSQWLHTDSFTPWYARWTNGKFQGEVDMIGLDNKKFKPLWALEIKWSNRFFDKANELKSLIQFCKKNNLKKAMVTSIDKEGIVNINDVELSFFPSAMYAYNIGLNTIESKKKNQ
jgi:predicted AAA+ superfamily ATPase